MTDDDVELLRRAARGDDGAAEQFYRRHVRYVWSVVRRFSLDDDEAMDASQETFARVFRKASFDGRSAITTWLFRVASRAAIDLVRSPRGRRHGALEHAPDLPAPDRIGDPLLRRRLARAIAELPDAQRESFILCEMMHMSHVEAAALLGIPEGTSRRRVTDARTTLRAALASLREP